MISRQNVKKFCKDFTKIENYEEATRDTTQIWECHHRLETHFSDGTQRPLHCQIRMRELVALEMYFDRPPEELIFLTKTEHNRLHRKVSGNSKKHNELLAEYNRTRKNPVKGTHWYFNGANYKRCVECPEGYWPKNPMNKGL